MTRISDWRALGEISRGLFFHDLALSGKSSNGTAQDSFPIVEGLERHWARARGWTDLDTSLWKVQKHVHTVRHRDLGTWVYLPALGFTLTVCAVWDIYLMNHLFKSSLTCIQLVLSVAKAGAAVSDTAGRGKENKQFLWKSIVIYFC